MKYIFLPRKSNAKATDTYIGHTDDTDGHCTIRSKDREISHMSIYFTPISDRIIEIIHR